MDTLTFRERPAAGDAAGLLVLHHGRGADERDLLGLGEMLDPGRRLHVVTPRAPLEIGGGYHWYVVPRVGYPDPETFHAAFGSLAAFHDQLWERTGIDPADTVFGGFSMGSVMSYSMGLGGDRPKPAGILAFSGFIPIVDGCNPTLPPARICLCSSPTGGATRSWRSISLDAPRRCWRPPGCLSNTTSPMPDMRSTPVICGPRKTG